MDPRFVLIVLFIVVLNLGYAGLQISLLRRRTPWPKSLAFIIGLWIVLMSGLFLVMAFAPFSWKSSIREWLYFPMAVEMIWNVLFLEALFLGMILIVLGMRLFRPVKKEEPSTPEGLSRRKFLYLLSYGAAPTVALGMGVHGTLSQNDLRVSKYNLPIANLPPELEGFTIAHVSDIHSGLFVGPERLKIISDMTNDLKADMIAITGDVINSEMAEFPSALKAINAMESRYGTYLCQGNHDLIPGPGEFNQACQENNLRLLWNAQVTLPVQGRRVIIAGMPWMKNGFPNLSQGIDSLFPQRQEGDVRLLMAHHPNLFDYADSTDVVLSGHTHGGQIMLGNDIGLGPIFFKYWSGLYQRKNTTMIVSNGCGDWFPCRIGALAEIGLLTLTKTPAIG